jgi:hypothetical protein
MELPVLEPSKATWTLDTQVVVLMSEICSLLTMTSFVCTSVGSHGSRDCHDTGDQHPVETLYVRHQASLHKEVSQRSRSGLLSRTKEGANEGDLGCESIHFSCMF